MQSVLLRCIWKQRKWRIFRKHKQDVRQRAAGILCGFQGFLTQNPAAFVEINDIFDFSAAPSIVFSIAHTTIHSKCGVEQFVCPQSVLSVGAARPSQPWHATNIQVRCECRCGVKRNKAHPPWLQSRDKQKSYHPLLSARTRLLCLCAASDGAINQREKHHGNRCASWNHCPAGKASCTLLFVRSASFLPSLTISAFSI